MSYNGNLYFNFICDPQLMPNVDLIAERADAFFNSLLDAARERTAALRG